MAGDVRVLDLFAGAGGLSSGLREASERFKTVGAVEWDVAAAASYVASHGPDSVFVGDIREWLLGDLPSADVIVGGPRAKVSRAWASVTSKMSATRSGASTQRRSGAPSRSTSLSRMLPSSSGHRSSASSWLPPSRGRARRLFVPCRCLQRCRLRCSPVSSSNRHDRLPPRPWVSWFPRQDSLR